MCDAEYPLQEAIELVPPELIPIGDSDVSIFPVPAESIDEDDRPESGVIKLQSTAIAVPTETSIKPSPGRPTSKPSAGLVTEPFFSSETKSVGETEAPPIAADINSDIAAPPIAPQFLSRYGATTEDEKGPQPGGASEETGDMAENTLDADVFNVIAEHKAKTGQNLFSQADQPAFHGRSRRKPKNPLRIFVEIVLGGVAGITIGYIVLAWIVWIIGARFDFPTPPQGLKPVLRFVLPDNIWTDKEQPRKNQNPP